MPFAIFIFSCHFWDFQQRIWIFLPFHQKSVTASDSGFFNDFSLLPKKLLKWITFSTGGNTNVTNLLQAAKFSYHSKACQKIWVGDFNINCSLQTFLWVLKSHRLRQFIRIMYLNKINQTIFHLFGDHIFFVQTWFSKKKLKMNVLRQQCAWVNKTLKCLWKEIVLLPYNANNSLHTSKKC